MKIAIRFSDTGDGIPEERRERVFDLFYTTQGFSAQPARQSTADGVGTGLGSVDCAPNSHTCWWERPGLDANGKAMRLLLKSVCLLTGVHQ